MSLDTLHVEQVVQGIKSREFSVEEYISQIFERIEKVEPKINALVTLNKEEGLNRARRLDKKIREGKQSGPLAGVAFSIKDNICTKGMKTTCASKIL